MTKQEELEQVELQRRVIFSMLQPAARLAAIFELPLAELTKFTQLVYFMQLRKRRRTLKELSASMDVSLRTAKRLAQRLRENFFAPETEHELPRRIEFMLGVQPMSETKLRQLLPDADPDALEQALQQLVGEERIVFDEDASTPSYRALRPVTRLASREGWIARIGALNALLSNTSNTVYGRFFEQDPKTFARTISFRLRQRDLVELREFYEDQLLEKLKELEERSRASSDELQGAEDEDTLEIQLSLLWAPYEYLDEPKGES